MPKRFISSDLWSDALMEQLSYKAKYLFLYLITSPYTSQAGIGQATDKKISGDTDLNREELPKIFNELAPVVSRLGEWFWIRNFFKHQCCNGSFAKGALRYAKSTPFFEEFKKENEDRLNTNTKTEQNSSVQFSSVQEVSAPCRHSVETVLEPYRNSIDTISENQPEAANYPSPEKALTIHSELLRALDKIVVSPEEIAIGKKLIDAGCTCEDIATARKAKGKNNLKYLQNIVCEMRDQRIKAQEDKTDYDNLPV